MIAIVLFLSLLLGLVFLTMGLAMKLEASIALTDYHDYSVAKGGSRQLIKNRLDRFVLRYIGKTGSFLNINECCEKRKKNGLKMIWFGGVILLISVGSGIYIFYLMR